MTGTLEGVTCNLVAKLMTNHSVITKYFFILFYLQGSKIIFLIHKGRTEFILYFGGRLNKFPWRKCSKIIPDWKAGIWLQVVSPQEQDLDSKLCRSFFFLLDVSWSCLPLWTNSRDWNLAPVSLKDRLALHGSPGLGLCRDWSPVPPVTNLTPDRAQQQQGGIKKVLLKVYQLICVNLEIQRIFVSFIFFNKILLLYSFGHEDKEGTLYRSWFYCKNIILFLFQYLFSSTQSVTQYILQHHCRKLFHFVWVEKKITI